MKRNLLKTLLVAVGLVMGINATWGQGVWSTIFSEDYNDANTFNLFWKSAAEGRYTINQTLKSDNDYAMEIVPVSNGNNGTTATYTGLTASNPTIDSYQTAEQFRISFEFNFCYNDNQAPFFQIMDSEGVELIGFYNETPGTNKGILRLKREDIGSFTLAEKTKTPTTYNTVVYYTENGGTYMEITWAGQSEATKYTIAENEIIHIGKMVHNTKRYYNHFVFDNLKVELYSEQEIVAAPQANVIAIYGTKRTISITAQDNSHDLYYYLGEDNSNPIKYTEPFDVNETTTLHYYSQSQSGAKSDIQDMEIECVEIMLTMPTALRTGTNSYKLTALQQATNGITPVATIRYTLDGQENTLKDGGTISNVNSDIVAWAIADGYKASEKTTIAHIPAYKTSEVWSYNLNSFPSTQNITSIENAIDTETETTLNGITVYNLVNINKPDLYIENSNGWLLRNQSQNAFKIQNAATSITFNNVTPQNVIYINGVDDNGRYRISNITNGNVKYSYNNNEYFIVPESEGAVSITFNTGVSINNVGVHKKMETVSVTDAGMATYCPAVALDFTGATKIAAYKASVSGNTVTLTKVSTVAAGEGVLLRALNDAATTEDIVIAAEAERNTGNDFTGVQAETTLNETDGEYTNYVLSKEGETVGFFKARPEADGGTKLAAGKAYLKVLTTNAAKGIKVIFDGETTGIGTIKDNTAKDNAIYNLNGQRVASPAKGLYIMNGKKIIVK